MFATGDHAKVSDVVQAYEQSRLSGMLRSVQDEDSNTQNAERNNYTQQETQEAEN